MDKKERPPVIINQDDPANLPNLTPHLDTFEDADMGYNPGRQHLDLSKDEKIRTTALMMAINAYQNLIIKDAV